MTQAPLSRYIEKLILALSAPFSQILSHIIIIFRDTICTQERTCSIKVSGSHMHNWSIMLKSVSIKTSKKQLFFNLAWSMDKNRLVQVQTNALRKLLSKRRNHWKWFLKLFSLHNHYSKIQYCQVTVAKHRKVNIFAVWQSSVSLGLTFHVCERGWLTTV